jgi:acyl-coenzyme A thioesterase PaaI-like protein
MSDFSEGFGHFSNEAYSTTEHIRLAMIERFQHLGDGYGPREQSLVELAAITRDLIQEATTTSTTPDVIAQAAALVREAVALLMPEPHVRPYFGSAEGSLGGGAPTSFFDYSPFVGLLSPLAPPLQLSLEGDRVVARATYQRQYEGPPSCVHGGIIAAGFDEVLGFTQSLSGQPGMTGTLEIRYRSPTPLFEEVTFEGWVVRVDGRKIFTEGTLTAVCSSDRAVHQFSHRRRRHQA